jgi:hypothetical protein
VAAEEGLCLFQEVAPVRGAGSVIPNQSFPRTPDAAPRKMTQRGPPGKR